MILKQPIYTFDGEYDFLSNFYVLKVPIEWLGHKWPTVEHAYQASKCHNYDDVHRFLACKHPGQTKKLGKTIQKRENWDFLKLRIMRTLVHYKFHNNPELMEKLLQTAPAHIEEGNWWGDVYWGISPAMSGNGQNNLGKLLMELRDGAIIKA